MKDVDSGVSLEAEYKDTKNGTNGQFILSEDPKLMRTGTDYPSIDDLEADTEPVSGAVEWQGEPPTLFNAKELLSRGVKEVPMLIAPVFPKVGVCAVAGSSDTGKSAFLRQLAVAVVAGKPDFLGFPLRANHQKAIYVSTEDDDFATANLLYKALKAEAPESFAGLDFIFESERLLESLDFLLSTDRRDLVVIDAFGDLYSGGMNQANEVRNFLNKFRELANKHQCLFIFLHHTGKRTERQVASKHNLLGSQGFEAKMRLVIELRHDPNEKDIRHLCIVKGNYLPKDMKQESHQLLFDESTLTFTNTGKRSKLEDVRELEPEETKGSGNSPDSFDNDWHWQLSKALFKGRAELSPTDLMTGIKSQLEGFNLPSGTSKSKAFKSHLTEFGFIKKTGKKNTASTYILGEKPIGFDEVE